MPRLDQLVAHDTGFSRRQATRLIRAGRLTGGRGEALTDAKGQVKPENLPWPVFVDGDPVLLRDRFHLMLHKPPGTVTALRDGRHPTAYALLRHAPL